MITTAQTDNLDQGTIAAATVLVQLPEIAVLPGSAYPGAGVVSVLFDCMELFKVKIVGMVLVTSWGGAYMGSSQSGVSSLTHGMLDGLLGIGLISAGAGALNEVIEYRSDRLMRRTANRPVAAGRIAPLHGLLAGFSALTLGAIWLLLRSNLATLILALLTALVYLAVYTPLKNITVFSTAIGAFPGAMGPLLGWVAAGGRIEWPVLSLFAILYVWQFPHFMAIAWLYREDYARASFRMLPVVEPDGNSTVIVAVGFALLMFPVSQIPLVLGMVNRMYGILALALSLYYLASSFQFMRILEETLETKKRAAARNLLKTSVLFLPMLFAALIICFRGKP